MGSVYTADQKQEALDLYQQIGARATAEQLDIPPRTVRHWATLAGLAKAREQNLEDGARMLAAVHQAKREEIRVRLMDLILDAMDRTDQKHIDYRGKDVVQVEWETAPAEAFKAYAVAIGVLIDKYRLEMGEATGRTESLTLDVIESNIQRLEARMASGAGDSI